MAYERKNKLGKLNVAIQVIAEIAGSAAVECYGVVGMASQNLIMDGISELLNKDNYTKGIQVTQLENGDLDIDIYIVAAYGVKISEIAVEVQKKVKYVLESALEVNVRNVNVHVQDIKVIG